MKQRVDREVRQAASVLRRITWSFQGRANQMHGKTSARLLLILVVHIVVVEQSNESKTPQNMAKAKSQFGCERDKKGVYH